MSQQLTITRPDDWHVHFRDHETLKYTVPATAKHFARALVMPNLSTPLTTLSLLLDYRSRILEAATDYSQFDPYMTFYLNETVSPECLFKARTYPFILGAKLYPAGVTTHSQQGAQSIQSIYPLLDIMQEQQLTLQIHGECLQSDIFDREAVFIEKYLKPILLNFPKLRIVLEHISTKAAVDFVSSSNHHLAATITVHHLLYNRNHLLAGGIKPHYYCLPILKRESDQNALINAATSGNPKFFAGTDSAPHAQQHKENACGCAGIYSAPYAIALYAQVFEAANKLQYLNHFLSRWGSEFYQLPLSNSQITLIQQSAKIPEWLPFAEDRVIPISSGETMTWSVNESS